MRHDEWLIKENISQLRQLMSDQNLQLLPDYEQRIEVLKDLGFVDQNSRVELKGKVACEVSPGSNVSISPTDQASLDSLCRRTRPDGTNTGERSRRLLPRRDSRPTVRICLPRKNRLRTYINTAPREGRRNHCCHFRESQQFPNPASSDPLER